MSSLTQEEYRGIVKRSSELKLEYDYKNLTKTLIHILEDVNGEKLL